MACRVLHPENGLKHGKGYSHALRPEQDKADTDQHKGAGNPKRLPKGAVRPNSEDPVHSVKHRPEQDAQDNQNAIVNAVQHVMPSRTMPQARCDPNHGQAEESRNIFRIAAEEVFPDELSHPLSSSGKGDGIEQIIPEPRAEGDMPPAPELGHRLRKIGPVEVFGKVDAHKLSGTGRDVDIPGKIRIDLNCIDYGGYRKLRPGVLRVRPVDRVDQDARAVRDHDFFEIPPQHKLRAELRPIIIEFARLKQLRRQIIISSNRPFHNLRKKREEQGQPCEIPFWWIFAAVHVDQIPHRLKRIERDAEW